MYNGVDYPYYEPTSNNSMSWQNHNSQQPGAQQQQSQPHPSQLPQNQSQTRFNRFNQGHHANGRDDQDHQSQEIVRIKSYTSQKYIKLPTYSSWLVKSIRQFYIFLKRLRLYFWRLNILVRQRTRNTVTLKSLIQSYMSLYIAESSRYWMPNHLLFVVFDIFREKS